MTGFDILEAMNDIDITEIDDMHIRKKPKYTYRKIAAVIAVVLVLSGTTVFAAMKWGVDIIKMFSDDEESGYDVSINIEPISSADIRGEIKTLSTAFVKRFEAYNPVSSDYPGIYSKEFNCSEDMVEYIGCDNLFIPKWNDEAMCILNVTGNENGEIESINTEVDYNDTIYRIQAFSTIYTEDYEGEFTTGMYTTNYESYTEGGYQSDSGIYWKIINVDKTENNYMSKEGYTVIDNVLYHVYIAYEKENETFAEQQFYEYLELYDER